jgi:uncharacterized oligopeptide transporter (OPT) family protein
MGSSSRPPELTLRALAVGLALGAALAAANVYAGLVLGFVDAGTMPIILVAFAAFGTGRRRLTAGEVNVAQVAGSSAGAMAVTAGLIGPVPALAMTGHDVAPALVALWGCALAVLGTLIAIPFRDSLIAVKRLAFPTARAAGELIRGLFADGARSGVRLLVAAAVLAAAATVARDALHAVPGGWMLPVAIAGVPAARLSIGVAASPLLAGVSLLVGARVGLSMLLGTAIAWLVIAPALISRGLAAPSYPALVAWTLWPGAAVLVAGSLTQLGLDGRALVRALRTGPAAAGASSRRLRIAIAIAGLAVIAIGWRGFGIAAGLGALAVGLAAVFAVAAMHATGETDNTPAGPLGGLTQIAVGAIGPGGTAAPLTAGGTVNGVAVHASTMVNAWKTGDVIGGSPARLVAAQLAGIAGGAVAGAIAYWLIRDAYGLGSAALPAPGALSWKATAEAVAGGTATMPAGAPLAALAGALAGVALAVAGRTRVRRFVPSAIAIGVGFIVPASIGAALALGAIGFAAVARRAPAWHARSGPALASGLIVGEALAGVALAAIVVARG